METWRATASISSASGNPLLTLLGHQAAYEPGKAFRMLLSPLNEIRRQEGIDALKAFWDRTWFLWLRNFFHEENIRLNYTLDKEVLALHTLTRKP
jgi:hypothetical protein